MNAIILAGGYATRLWPITKNKPKPLLPLAGKPILSYILDELEEIEQIKKIYITTNERFEDSFNKYIEGREKDKYELIIEKQKSEEEKYGAIGGIINALELSEKTDHLVIGGDNYYSFEIKKFIELCTKKEKLVNACFEVGSLEEAKNYGIVNFDQNKRMIDFQEKPEEPKSKMASTAFYYFPENIMDVFDEYTGYWEGKISKVKYLDEPGRFLDWASERYDCYAYPFTGIWADVGTRQGYLRAEEEVKESNQQDRIIRGKTIDSKIEENTTILEGSNIVNSTIEGSIIFKNTTIKNAVIKDSIVDENTEIEDLELREGLVSSIDN